MTTAIQNFQEKGRNTKIAGGAIEANRFVKLDTTQGQVIACTAITDVAIGVSLNKAASGESVQIQTQGEAKVATSAAVAINDQVMCTASGAGKCSTAAGATARSVGLATSATGGTDGELATVLLCVPNLNAVVNT